MSSRVKFNLGFTRNMGDFESLRMDVGIESDQMDGETTAQALARVKEFVQVRFYDMLEEVESDVREIRGK